MGTALVDELPKLLEWTEKLLKEKPRDDKTLGEPDHKVYLRTGSPIVFLPGRQGTVPLDVCTWANLGQVAHS